MRLLERPGNHYFSVPALNKGSETMVQRIDLVGLAMVKNRQINGIPGLLDVWRLVTNSKHGCNDGNCIETIYKRYLLLHFTICTRVRARKVTAQGKWWHASYFERVLWHARRLP